jgi:F420-dependent oxidoreductase-like protein
VSPAPLGIGFQVWGQFVKWPELMATARDVEQLGFDSLWSNDHFYPPFGRGNAGGIDGPMFEGWMVLAGFVAETRRVRVGCLVSGAGYRNPALLVKMATALDHASGGRLVLGIGAGWFEREHRSLGFDFPSVKERLDRLEESAAIISELLDGGMVTRAGRWHSVSEARNDPPPLQGGLPLIIGGSGERRTLPIVARYADWWNGEGDPETVAHKNAVLDEYCRAIGRDPAEIRRTVGLPPPLIRSDRAEAVSQLASIFAQQGMKAEDARENAETSRLVGRADEVAAYLAEHRESGAEEVIFDWPAPFDTQTLQALAGPVRKLLE